MGMMLIKFESNMQTSIVHYHDQREEAYLVLQGSVTLLVNGKEHRLTPHTVVFIPPGDRHGIIHTGNEGFTMIEI